MNRRYGLDDSAGYPILASKAFFVVPVAGKLLQSFSVKLVINGAERSFDGELTLAALVEQLGVKPDRVAVELNHNIVRRDAWPATLLHDGDRLEVVHFVGGGGAASQNLSPADLSARWRLSSFAS